MKLLVPIDASETSLEAVKHLRLSGISMGARVRFVHVMKGGQQAKEVSHNFVEMTALLTNASSVETIYAEGDPAERVVQLAAEWEADLIVVGTSDKRGLDRLLLGSVAKTILSKADCPVLILRGQPAAITNVLVAADDSPSSAASVEWLSNQAWAQHKNLALLSVMDEAPPAIQSEFSSVESVSEAMARKQLEEVRISSLSQSWSDLCASNLKKPQIPFVLTDGSPAESILELSKSWPVDLIVLGSHCKTGITKILLGSVSETVASKAPCSVLVVRDIEATRFEEIRLQISASIEASKSSLKTTHKARANTSLAVNDFAPHFPSMM